MSRVPKFADSTKVRKLHRTPAYKYFLGGTIAITYACYQISYYVFELLLKEKLQKLRSKYKFLEQPINDLEDSILQKMITLRLLAEKEDEATKK